MSRIKIKYKGHYVLEFYGAKFDESAASGVLYLYQNRRVIDIDGSRDYFRDHFKSSMYNLYRSLVSYDYVTHCSVVIDGVEYSPKQLSDIVEYFLERYERNISNSDNIAEKIYDLKEKYKSCCQDIDYICYSSEDDIKTYKLLNDYYHSERSFEDLLVLHNADTKDKDIFDMELISLKDIKGYYERHKEG